MSRNRILGTPQNTNQLPTAAASTYNEGYQDDVLVVPAAAAAGTPWCTVNLNGSQAGQTGPADGDVIEFSDAFGALAAGTTLVIVGVSGGNGKQIADGAALANSVTLSTAGARRKYCFSGAANCWVRCGGG